MPFGCRLLRLLVPAIELADHRAGVLFDRLGKLDQRRPDFDQVTLGAKQMRDAAAPGRRNLDHGLVGLDRNQRLIRHHMIAFVDMPADDLSFFEAFAEIRQYELAHDRAPD